VTAVGPWYTEDAAVDPLDLKLSSIEEAPPQIEGEPPIQIPEAAPTALLGFRRIAALLVLADAAVAILWLIVLAATHSGTGRLSDFLIVLALAPLVWVGIFHSFGLYGIRYLAPSEEFRRLISAVTLGILVITVGSVWWERALDRPSLAASWFAVLVAELLVRRIVHRHVGRAKERGALALRTLIVGTNQEADSIADVLSAPVRGFHPIGFISPSPSSPTGDRPVLGSLDDLPDVIRRTSAECVFVASSAISSADLYRVSRCCRQANIEMRLSANTREVLTSRVSVHQVRDLVVLAVRSAHLTKSQAAVKRSFDLVVGTIALLVALPLGGAIALAIRLTSPGPILFRQERVTKDGRRFIVYKFRTMTWSPTDAGETVIDISSPYFKMRSDPRLTRVGRMLRSWSLDELPQIWNVLLGDMSLVGPRPLAREQVEAGSELMDARHEVRTGLTGWWQINGRSDVEAEDALRMDLFYIENWSLALDLYVVLKTIGVVLGRKGAY
jgi:exopolysaccharide biosynthesis polyprenyl glycosylphosphotransferase